MYTILNNKIAEEKNMLKQNIHKKIGIIGGGQLGQMMILEGKKMGFYITGLDPTLH